MKIARLEVEGEEIAALEHGGFLHRVDRLDAVLGVPWSEAAAANLVSFQRRVLSLGPATLEGHLEALVEGTHLADTRAEGARMLPPVGVRAEVLELRDGVAFRVSSRALHGHDATILVEAGAVADLRCAGAIAVVLGEDLHRPGPVEARRAVLGLTLALAWRLGDLSGYAGPAGAREIGTHIGPWLSVRPLGDQSMDAKLTVGSSVANEVALHLDSDSVIEALVWAARFGDLFAGDVLIVPGAELVRVPTFAPVTLAAGALGVLRGVVES